MNQISRPVPRPGALPVGVVGGGLGGLASACVLAARGHRVVLFDKNEWLGARRRPSSRTGSASTWAPPS